MHLNDEIIQLDTAGYLVRQEDWHEEVAIAIAQIDGLLLTQAHWEIIYFLRDFYQRYQTTPPVRALVKALANQLGVEKGNSLYLHQLFPQGPVKQASKIAGLPKPSRCI